jgi:hypothetical protein
MTRLAVLAALLALALSPAASAQGPPPPDERAAAQAFADAAGRFAQAVKDLEDEGDDVFRPGYRACRPLARRVPKNRRADADALLTRHQFREVAALLETPLKQLRTDLANAQTRDPALLSGRAAWRQLGRLFAALPPATDACAELRAWLRAGAPHSEGREAIDELRPVVAASGREYDRKLRAATRRMIELGVPKEQAETFSNAG